MTPKFKVNDTADCEEFGAVDIVDIYQSITKPNYFVYEVSVRGQNTDQTWYLQESSLNVAL